MEDVEELPTWAARTHVPGSNLPVEEPEPERRRPWRLVLIGLLAVLALVAIAALGYLAADRNTGDDTGTTDEASAADTGDSAGSSATESGADSADAAGDTAATADDADSATESASQASDGSPTEDSNSDDRATDGSNTDDRAAVDSNTDDQVDDGAVEASRGEPVDNSDGSIRYAVLEGGQLFLRGRVHSEAYGQRIEEVALGVMGPGNVVNEYEVDPDTPDVIGGPVYVEDVVLFEFNSIEVAPAFLPILDLGTALMTQNPTVEITIVSRTDSAGSEAVNMEVSEQRAGAVVNYWARQGIDTSRLTIDARGEEEASAGDDESEAALDRRVEFIINNLFG